MSSGLKTLLIFHETGWLRGILISIGFLQSISPGAQIAMGETRFGLQEPPSQPPSNWSMIWLLESCLQGKKHPQDSEGWTSNRPLKSQWMGLRSLKNPIRQWGRHWICREIWTRWLFWHLVALLTCYSSSTLNKVILRGSTLLHYLLRERSMTSSKNQCENINHVKPLWPSHISIRANKNITNALPSRSFGWNRLATSSNWCKRQKASTVEANLWKGGRSKI